MVKEDAQLRDGDRTTGRMGQDGPHLCDRHAGKPFDELVNWDIIFEILEECRDGHARPAKQPSTAVSLGILLDGIAGGPVNHVGMIIPSKALAKDA